MVAMLDPRAPFAFSEPEIANLRECLLELFQLHFLLVDCDKPQAEEFLVYTAKNLATHIRGLTKNIPTIYVIDGFFNLLSGNGLTEAALRHWKTIIEDRKLFSEVMIGIKQFLDVKDLGHAISEEQYMALGPFNRVGDALISFKLGLPAAFSGAIE